MTKYSFPRLQVSEFVWEASLTILEATAEENYKDHYIVVSNRSDFIRIDLLLFFVKSHRLTPDSEPIKIREDFDVNVAGLTVTIIVVIIIVVLIVAILGIGNHTYTTCFFMIRNILNFKVSMMVVYSKKNNILCFKDKSSSQNSPDVTALKEPLNVKVQHHPYARPSS